MQYIYVLKLIPRLLQDENWTTTDNLIVDDHFNYLKKLLENKTLILAGRTLNEDESKFGIVIFEASSINDARKIMSNDPAVNKGIMNAELYPYRVALIQ